MSTHNDIDRLRMLFDWLLEMTIPDKPNSRLQKYRLTEKGCRWLKSQEGMGGKKLAKE